MKLLFATIALATPAAVPAATPPIAAPAAVSDVDRLVELLAPDRKMLDLVMTTARGQALRAAAFENDPAMVDFVLARMRPEIDRSVRAALPELRAELARILSAALTPGDIADLYSFFASPTGQRMQQIAFAVIAEHPDADAETQQQLTVERFMASLTPSDYGPLTAFGASGGAQKLPAISPQIRAASEDWAQRLILRNNDSWTALRAQAIADYKRQKGAK